MRPTTIELRNFTSYVEADVDLTAVRCAALVGHNGAGKSSLLDALTWALFGEGTKGGPRALDNYVRRGKTEASVAVEFTLHGHHYRVERTRNLARQRTTLRLLEQTPAGWWRDIGGKSVAEAQAAIERLLRMDFRTFSASSLILQGKSDTLTADMTDAERKDVLARILGLDIWDELLEAAKSRLRQVEAQRAALQLEADRLRAEASKHDEIAAQIATLEEGLAALASTIADLEADVATRQAEVARIPSLEARLRELAEAITRGERELRQADADAATARRQRAQADTMRARREEILAATERAQTLETELQALEEVAGQVLALSRRIEQATTELAKAERAVINERATLQATIQVASKQEALLGSVPCAGTDLQPRCQLLATARQAAQDAQAARERLPALERNDAVTTLRETLKVLQRERATLAYDEALHQATRAAAREARTVADLRPALEAADQRAAELEARLAALTAQAEERRGALDQHRTAQVATQAELDALRPARQALEAAQRDLAAQRALEARARETLGGLRATLEASAAAAARLEALQTETAALDEAVRVWQVLVAACSTRGGVPALIVETAVPEIERLANQLLERMAGGRLRIRLETQQETKAGTLAEVLRIVVLDGGVERPYVTYSGAERLLTDVALRVALSKFLVQRAGAEIQFLILDEGIGSLDATNRGRILEILYELSRDFPFILVISHLPDVQESFPQQILVSRNGAGSRVEVRV